MTSPTVARFQLLSAGQLAIPHKCSVCGGFSAGNGPVERQFIDFGLLIDFYGSVYICTFCLPEAVALLDLIPIAKYDEAMIQRNEFQKVIASLVKENRELRNELDSLRDLNRPDPNTYNYFAPTEPVTEDQTVGDGVRESDSSPDSSEDDRITTEDKSRSDEPTDVGRSEDLRSDVGSESAASSSFDNSSDGGFSRLGLHI